MSLTRLYQAVPLNPQTELTLDEGASHHLGKVLRASPGEKVIIFNGQGGEFAATIKRIDKKAVTVYIEAFVDRNPESSLDICLAQGISRGEKMDFTIQKAVELGVRHIVPLLTERCNVKLDADRLAKKVDHWQAVAISAAEQSGRTYVPIIQPVVNLSSWSKSDRSEIRLVLAPGAGQSVAAVKFSTAKTVSLVVGPEGGLSEPEINQLVKENFFAINLGPRILRTETAGLAAISIIQGQFGDMR